MRIKILDGKYSGEELEISEKVLSKKQLKEMKDRLYKRKIKQEHAEAYRKFGNEFYCLLKNYFEAFEKLDKVCDESTAPDRITGFLAQIRGLINCTLDKFLIGRKYTLDNFVIGRQYNE